MSGQDISTRINELVCSMSYSKIRNNTTISSESQAQFTFMNQPLDAVIHECGGSDSVAKVLLVERCCFTNSIRLVPLMERVSGKEMHIVAGSLGLCDPQPTWYEWGGDKDTVYTEAVSFAGKKNATGLPSVHFWLSDAPPGEAGLVYDVLDPYLWMGPRSVVALHKKSIKTQGFWHGLGIMGISADVLENSHGLKYVQASPLITQVMITRHMNRLKHVSL